MTDVPSALVESLKNGRIDACELIAAPERFGELGRTAEAMTIAELVALEPLIEDGDVEPRLLAPGRARSWNHARRAGRRRP